MDLDASGTVINETSTDNGLQTRWNRAQTISVPDITQKGAVCWRQFRFNQITDESERKRSSHPIYQSPPCPVRWGCVSGASAIKNNMGESSGVGLASDNADCPSTPQNFNENVSTPELPPSAPAPSSTAPSPSKDKILHITRQTPNKQLNKSINSINIFQSNIVSEREDNQFDRGDEFSLVEENSFYREVSTSHDKSGIVADGVIAAQQEDTHHCSNTHHCSKSAVGVISVATVSQECQKTPQNLPNGTSPSMILPENPRSLSCTGHMGDKGDSSIEAFDLVNGKQQQRYNPIPLSIIHQITQAAFECKEEYKRCILVCEGFSDRTEVMVLWSRDWYHNTNQVCQATLSHDTQEYESPLVTAASLISPEGGDIAAKIETIFEEFHMLKQQKVSATSNVESWLRVIFTLVEFGEKLYKYAEINIVLEDNATAKGWDIVKPSEIISHLKAVIHDSNELNSDHVSLSYEQKSIGQTNSNLITHLASYMAALRDRGPYNAEDVASAFKSLQHALVYCDEKLRAILDKLLYLPVEDFMSSTRKVLCKQLIPVLENANRLIIADKCRPRKEKLLTSKEKYISSLEDVIQDLAEPLSLVPPEDTDISIGLDRGLSSSHVMLREPDKSTQYSPVDRLITSQQPHYSKNIRSLPTSQPVVEDMSFKLPHYMKKRPDGLEHSTAVQQEAAKTVISVRGVSPPAPALVEIKKALRKNPSKSVDYDRCDSEQAMECVSFGAKDEVDLSHINVSVRKNLKADSPQGSNIVVTCTNRIVPQGILTGPNSIFTPSKSPKTVPCLTGGEEMTKSSPAKYEGRSHNEHIKQRERSIKSPINSPRLTASVAAMIENAKLTRERSKMPKKDTQLTVNRRLKKFVNISSKIDSHFRYPTVDRNSEEKSFDASLGSVLAHNLNIDDESPVKGINQTLRIGTSYDHTNNNNHDDGTSFSQCSTGRKNTSPLAVTRGSIFSSPVNNTVKAQSMRRPINKRRTLYKSGNHISNHIDSQQKPERQVTKRSYSVAEIRSQHRRIDVSNLPMDYNFIRQSTASYKEEEDRENNEDGDNSKIFVPPVPQMTVYKQPPTLPFQMQSPYQQNSPQDTSGMMRRLKNLAIEHKAVVKERNILKKQLTITRLERDGCSPIGTPKRNYTQNTANPQRSRRRSGVASYFKSEDDNSPMNKCHVDPVCHRKYSPAAELLSSPSATLKGTEDVTDVSPTTTRTPRTTKTTTKSSLIVNKYPSVPTNVVGTSSSAKHPTSDTGMVNSDMKLRNECVDGGGASEGIRVPHFPQHKPALVVSRTALLNITSSLNSIVNTGKLDSTIPSSRDRVVKIAGSAEHLKPHAYFIGSQLSSRKQ